MLYGDTKPAAGTPAYAKQLEAMHAVSHGAQLPSVGPSGVAEDARQHHQQHQQQHQDGSGQLQATAGGSTADSDAENGPLPIVWRGQKAYEQARVGRVFNLRKPEGQPAAVLEASTVSHVKRGVQLAAERGLKVAIRSGGHSWAGLSVRAKSLLIDLGSLHELSYDTATRIVTASPSTTGGILNPYLAQWGRFFAGGHCPTVGIGGFLLQGGQGWGARGWGWSCEQIDSMDVVLADGSLVTCSESQHSDLFWAARGAGPGFFGVVVRFRLRTRPIALAMHHTTLLIPAQGNFEACCAWWLKMNRQLHRDVESVMLSFSRKRLFPDCEKDDPQPDPLDSIMVIRGTYLGNDDDEAVEALAPFLQCPAIDHAIVKVVCAPTSMPQEYEQQLADNPPARYFVDNAWIHGEDEDVVDSLKPAYGKMPSEESFFLTYSMAPLRPLPDMAFDIQSEHYTAGYIINSATSDSRAGDESCQNWLRNVFDGIDAKVGKSGGTIGQYTGDSELTRRPSKFMSDDHWQKFCKIRDQYDPSGTFCGFMAPDGYSVNQASGQ